MKHSPSSQVANINIQFGKVWEGDVQTTRVETQNDFKNLLLAVYPYAGLQFLLGEPMWWGSLLETVGQTPGSQTWLYNYLQVYYLLFCPYLLPQKSRHYQLYFPPRVVRKAKQENKCEIPLEKCIIHNVCKCK